MALVLSLALATLLTSCSRPGSGAVTRSEAQTAYVAAGMVGWEGVLLSTMGGVDNGTVGTHMMRRTVDSTVFLDWNPSDSSYPTTVIITTVGYNETATGYLVNGTITSTAYDVSTAEETYDITLSHATRPVKTITGTLTKSGGVWDGSLSFNGMSYSYSDLNTL